MKQDQFFTLRGPGPYGFRVRGGKEFHSPLMISYVTPGSKAHLAGIESGLQIKSINGVNCEEMTHYEATTMIQQSCNHIVKLCLSRYSSPPGDLGNTAIDADIDKQRINSPSLTYISSSSSAINNHQNQRFYMHRNDNEDVKPQSRESPTKKLWYKSFFSQMDQKSSNKKHLTSSRETTKCCNPNYSSCPTKYFSSYEESTYKDENSDSDVNSSPCTPSSPQGSTCSKKNSASSSLKKCHSPLTQRTSSFSRDCSDTTTDSSDYKMADTEHVFQKKTQDDKNIWHRLIRAYSKYKERTPSKDDPLSVDEKRLITDGDRGSRILYTKHSSFDHNKENNDHGRLHSYPPPVSVAQQQHSVYAESTYLSEIKPPDSFTPLTDEKHICDSSASSREDETRTAGAAVFLSSTDSLAVKVSEPDSCTNKSASLDTTTCLDSENNSVRSSCTVNKYLMNGNESAAPSSQTFPFQASVLFRFKQESSRELNLKKGDVITILRDIDKYWYEAAFEDGLGIVPKYYVKKNNDPVKPKKPENQQASVGLARALCPYNAKSSVELSFKEGDIFFVSNIIDEKWAEARSDKKVGIILRSAIEVVIASQTPLSNPSCTGTEDKQVQNSQLSPLCHHMSSSYQSNSPLPPSKLKFSAKYAYIPKLPDEISLEEGDVVVVTRVYSDGWCEGFNERTKQQGAFPANYLKSLESENITQESL